MYCIHYLICPPEDTLTRSKILIECVMSCSVSLLDPDCVHSQTVTLRSAVTQNSEASEARVLCSFA